LAETEPAYRANTIEHAIVHATTDLKRGEQARGVTGDGVVPVIRVLSLIIAKRQEQPTCRSGDNTVHPDCQCAGGQLPIQTLLGKMADSVRA
jgi:hypothetical protein